MNVDSADYQETKEKYKPELTSLTDIYLNPTYNPLATVMATVIMVVMGYQVMLMYQQQGLAGGIVGAVTVYGAYRLAQTGWKYENDVVASELAQAELDPEQESPDRVD